MSKNKKTYQIPTLNDGSVLHYPDVPKDKIIWTEPKEFVANLKFIECIRGRSAAYFIFENLETKATYPMFISDFEGIFKERIIHQGNLFGKWIAVKRGSNFGIKPVE